MDIEREMAKLDEAIIYGEEVNADVIADGIVGAIAAMSDKALRAYRVRLVAAQAKAAKAGDTVGLHLVLDQLDLVNRAVRLRRVRSAK